MNTKIKYLGLGAATLTGVLALAPQASAQSIATADPEQAMYKSAAFTNAMTQITTANKADLDKAEALSKEVQPLEQAFDVNKDNRLDEAESAKMRASTSWAKIQANETQIQQLQLPTLRARAYVIEQLAPKVNQAYKNVLAAKKVSLVIRPEAVLTADAAADITDDITAELNKLATTVNATPPAGWQPGGAGAAPVAPAPKGPLPSGVPGAVAPAPAPAAPGKKPAGR